jgi:hypothetical protein
MLSSCAIYSLNKTIYLTVLLHNTFLIKIYIDRWLVLGRIDVILNEKEKEICGYFINSNEKQKTPYIKRDKQSREMLNYA